jgi:anti-sigma regulatory factor (Ser/Thr protein kinase)
MRCFKWLFFVVVLVAATASPAAAKVAAIQTTAPLQDHAEQSVKTAILEAVQAAVTGAMAMGLPWVQINKALVLENAVAVQIVATDTGPDQGAGEEAPGPDDESGGEGNQPSKTEL